MSFGNIALAILVFSVIIIFHEFGHFIVAKWNKITVIEFSLGMGPRLATWVHTDRGRRLYFLKSAGFYEVHPASYEKTIYSLKLLPFGGSCMMYGEEEEMVSEKAPFDEESSFARKSVYARMAVIFAGPFFNFLLAFLLSVVLVAFVGYDMASVNEVGKGMPMEEAGVQAGDVITEINGKKIATEREFRSYLMFHEITDEPVNFVIERNGEERALTVTPRLMEQEDGTERYMLGFSHGSSQRTRVSGFQVVQYAFYEVRFWITTTVQSLGQLIAGKVSPKDISGPVGIVQFVGNTVDANAPGGAGLVALSLIDISILLSANLGVMNLLPIPALDGGRLLFLIVEWIRRKPISSKVETYVNMTGFVLLMILMVLILGNDILKIIR